LNTSLPLHHTSLPLNNISPSLKYTPRYYSLYKRLFLFKQEHHWFHDYEPWSLIGFISAFVMATALFLPAQVLSPAISLHACVALSARVQKASERFCILACTPRLALVLGAS